MARTPEEIREFNLAAQEFLTVITSISNNLKENAKEQKVETDETIAKSVLETAKAKRLAEEVKQIGAEEISKQKKRIKIYQEIDNLKSIQRGVDAEILELESKQEVVTEGLSKLEQKRLGYLRDANGEIDGFLNIAKEVKQELQEIDEKTAFFNDMADLFRGIPLLGPLFKEFDDAAQAAAKAAAEGGDYMAAGAQQLIGAAGKIATAFAVSNLIGGIVKGSERATDFARNLNISSREAQRLNNNLARISRSTIGLVSEDFINAITTVSDQLGISANLSEEQLKAFGTMTTKLGLTNEQAGLLTSLTAATGQELTKFNTDLIGTVIQQNLATDSAVRYQDVLKDIADAGAATQLTVSKFPGGLAQAAYQARKFGLSMSMLQSSADSLLNFESSIEAELEAELLTGKQLNLERARAAALMGNQATLAQELAKNFGSIEEFQSRSVIAQEAQAKAMGMTRDQLADALIRQKAMTELNFDMTKSFEQNVKDRQQSIKKLREEGRLQAALNMEKELYQEIGETEFGRQQENVSLMEAQKELLTEIRDAAQLLAAPFTFVTEAFKFLGYGASELLAFLTKTGSKAMALGKVFKDYLVNPADEIVAAMKSVYKGFETLPKALLKGFKGIGASALKKIPFLGALVGLAMGIKRFSEGDIIGGAAEILSGVVSIVPLTGTAASLGIDAVLAGTDMLGVTGENRGDTQKYAGNIIRSGLLLPTAGTAAAAAAAIEMKNMLDSQNKTNQLLETIANKDQTINMDGNKVGHLVNAASQKTG